MNSFAAASAAHAAAESAASNHAAAMAGMDHVVHVECVQKRRSSASLADVLHRVHPHLCNVVRTGLPGAVVRDFSTDAFLADNVEELFFAPGPDGLGRHVLDFAALAETERLEIHVYQLNEDAPAEEYDEEEDTSSALQWLLPCRTLRCEFHHLWDTLIYDSDIKQELLDFARTTLRFSDCGVDPNIVSWNRVILLHGPPGTGKTSLCKALAQKLTVRLADRFTHGQLIEINSHSLFSKWFSESGKLVGKMFANIRELIANEDGFVCVLMDEVESLAAARQAAANGSEPSDAIRVVNALLTQIDQLRSHKNVLILTTSNITGAIDLAFVDRADVKVYIGPPSERARYAILASCIRELIRTGLVADDDDIADYSTLELVGTPLNGRMQASVTLLQIACRCDGLSGRMLRKLPFLAHAFYCARAGMGMRLHDYLAALDRAVTKELESRAMLTA